MGVGPRVWMCADVRRCARMRALTGTRTALVPNHSEAAGTTPQPGGFEDFGWFLVHDELDRSLPA
jgi:hypothetical protein